MALKTGLETWLGKSWLLPLEGQGTQQGRLWFHCSEWSKGILEISRRPRRVYIPGNVEQEDRGHFRQTETRGMWGEEEALSEHVKSAWHSKWFWGHDILYIVGGGTVMSKSNTSQPWGISKTSLRSGSEWLSLRLVQVQCWWLASVYKNWKARFSPPRFLPPEIVCLQRPSKACQPSVLSVINTLGFLADAAVGVTQLKCAEFTWSQSFCPWVFVSDPHCPRLVSKPKPSRLWQGSMSSEVTDTNIAQ